MSAIYKMSVVYVAGPMRGYEWFNFPAFDAAVEELKSRIPGVQVISPADIDRKYGFDPLRDCPPDYDWNVIPDTLDMNDAMLRDLKAVMECDSIFMLPGWSKSKGAITERALAETLGKTIIYQDGAEKPGDGGQYNPDGEHIVENATTGGKKGQKNARFDLIPPYPLWKLAELYGAGAKKYADHNWLRGYDWSLSFAAAMRHLWQFWGGEEIDPETGMPHATCAAFHCFTLVQFMETFRDGDDRPKPPSKVEVDKQA